MKTPEDFGIDSNGGRYYECIYSMKHLNYYDAEEHLEWCRTRFAEDVYHAEPLPEWDGATQQFLVIARKVYRTSGDEGLMKYFNEFAEFVMAHLPLVKIIDEYQNYNSRVLAYNDYICEQKGMTHTQKHPDYILELLKWYPVCWKTYWDYCGSDSQNCGGNFRREYAADGNRDDWGKRYDYFVDSLTNVFNERINKVIQEHEELTKSTEPKHNKNMTTTEVKQQIEAANIVEVIFTKKNGERRVMNASRNWQFLRDCGDELEYSDPTGKPNYDREAAGHVLVWDCDERDWRTIIAANVISIRSIDEEC